MQFSLLSAAWLLQTFQGTLGLAIQPNGQPPSLSRRQDLTQAATQLQSELSSGAVVTFPDDAGWEELQIRGSSPRVSPAYSVVVEVASESDVVKTVSIANKYNVPFLAVSGTHGWTETLNKLPYGIQVRMRKLNTATVSTNGKTATIGGGMLQWEITRALFAKGKYAGTHAFFHPPTTLPRFLHIVQSPGLPSAFLGLALSLAVGTLSFKTSTAMLLTTSFLPTLSSPTALL